MHRVTLCNPSPDLQGTITKVYPGNYYAIQVAYDDGDKETFTLEE